MRGILFISLTLIVNNFYNNRACCDELLDSLNGMQKLMTDEDTFFDIEFYDELVTCLNTLDPKLLESVNGQWSGFKEYAATGGNPNIDPPDDWKRCELAGKWLESNCTVQEYGNIPIWEPCNYASNIAYYHTTTEICNRPTWTLDAIAVKYIGKSFASLALASSFWHGSETRNGQAADRRINDLFAYVTYQEVAKMLKGNTSVLFDLNYQPRELSGQEITDLFMNMYIETPVQDWGHILNDTDFPDLRITMCGYFSLALTMTFEETFVDNLTEILANAFSLPEDMTEFCFNTYLPEAREATRNILPLPDEEKSKLRGNIFGTLLKLGYAFLWQEVELTDSDFFLRPEVNEIGAALLPVVNVLSTQLTTFEYSSSDFQLGQNFYPGELGCNKWDPHCKWHLQTGIALVDFVYLSDEMFRLLNIQPMVRIDVV